jgi:hypothetical protein
MTKLYYDRWKAKGLCVTCGNAPQAFGTTLCEKNWYKNKEHQAKYRAATIQERRERNQKWYAATREVRRRVVKSWGDKLKREVFDAYGGMCICCGEAELIFLTLDHIDGQGAKDRQRHKGNGASGRSLYYRLKREGYPKTFQILCANCNWAKFAAGRCPHERSVLSIARTA